MRNYVKNWKGLRLRLIIRRRLVLYIHPSMKANSNNNNNNNNKTKTRQRLTLRIRLQNKSKVGKCLCVELGPQIRQGLYISGNVAQLSCGPGLIAVLRVLDVFA